jgi:23S rRNA (uracil1939-C5)-methyltransferase
VNADSNVMYKNAVNTNAMNNDPLKKNARIELPHSPRYGEVLEVEIEGLSLDGMGVASLPALVGPQKQPKQYTFHVRKAIPGDRVRVAVEGRKKRVVTAHIDEMIEPSPMRIEPRCRHFGRREVAGKGCGGCTFQSMSYRHQLINKERIIKAQMQAQGVDPGLVFPMIGQDEPWYYRNKMEFSFGTDAEREFSLGLYPKGYRYEVLSLKECFLESEFVSDFLPKIQRWAAELGLEPYREGDKSGYLRTLTIREGKRTGERMLELTTTHAERARCGGEEVDAAEIARRFCEFILTETDAFTSIYWTQQYVERGEPTRFIEHHLHGKPVLLEKMHLPGDQVLSFEIHPRAFFQPNTFQAEVLYAQVLEHTGLLSATSKKRVLDLYCGTGTIGLCMAPYTEHVAGIELQPNAVDNARQNAAQNGVENVTFFAGDVAKVLQQDEFKAAAGAIDLVIVDPPRAGLLKEAREQLKEIDAPRVVYVSCNPKSLARDLAELADFGYAIDRIQPVDMFPHTYHVENVALLTCN